MRKICSGLVLLLIFAGYCGALDQIQVRRIKNYVETGKKAYTEKDYNTAALDFSKALELSPESPDLKYNLARAYIGQAVEKKSKGDAESAKEILKNAVALVENLVDARLFLSSIYLNEGDYVSAKGELEISKIFEPDNPAVYIMLGEVCFQQGDLENAIGYWDNSITNSAYNVSLNKKIERAKKEWNIQKNFKHISSHPFRIMYAENNKQLAENIMRILKSAYSEIGKKLDFYPMNEVIAVIYEPDEFFSATSAQGPVASLYDGKIRVRISPKLNDGNYLKSIIYHEYTHVIIRYLTGDNCPFWLNEGLAQVFSAPVSGVDLTTISNLELESEIFSLNMLENFEGKNKWADYDIGLDKSIKLAYAKSFISANYILKNYGIEACVSMLEGLKQKNSIDKCIEKSLNISIDELDRKIQQRISELKDTLVDRLDENSENKEETKIR